MAESAQARQRQMRQLTYRHDRRLILGHPDRELGQGTVRLADSQTNFVATSIPAGNNDRFSATGMKFVTDNCFIQRIVGSMKLLRRRRAQS